MSLLALKKSITFLTVYLSLFGVAYGAEDAAKEASKGPKSSEESFAVVQARVAALEAKLRSGETEIQKLIEEKHKTQDPARLSEVVQQMIALHKGMKENQKEYDQQRTLLKYRYPEKGLTGDREYERIDVKSLEEIEHQMSLGASVKKTLRKVRSQYTSPDDGKTAGDESSAKMHKSTTPASSPGLVDPVILKK